jgi:hypothetical protein
MFDTGSGDALTASRRPAFAAWLASAVEPPRTAAKASLTSCASPASSAPMIAPIVGRIKV